MTQGYTMMETLRLLDAGRSRNGSVPADCASRRPYSTPRLTVFGDLRGITLGGSPGISDSGGSNMEDMVFFTNDYNGIP